MNALRLIADDAHANLGERQDVGAQLGAGGDAREAVGERRVESEDAVWQHDRLRRERMRRRDLRRSLIPFGLRGAVDEGGTHRDVVAVDGSIQDEPLGRSIGRVLQLRAPGDGVDRSSQPALHGDGRPGCVLLNRDFLAPHGRAAQKDRVARRFRRCGGRVLLWRPGGRLLRRGRSGQDQAQRTGKIEPGAKVRGCEDTHLPRSYQVRTSRMDDYRHIREEAAVGAIAPRHQLAVAGPDRATYLQGLLTNDIPALSPGTGCYSAWLTPQGRMLTDMHVLESGSMILLDVPAETTAATRERLEQFIFSEDVQVASLAESLAGVWIHGPKASGCSRGRVRRQCRAGPCGPAGPLGVA